LARARKRRGSWVDEDERRGSMDSHRSRRFKIDSERSEGGRAQGRLGGVLEGVQVAPLEGHVSRSAVYLVHKEVRNLARF